MSTPSTHNWAWARLLARSGWLIVIGAAVAGAAIGYGVSLRIHPSYSAEAMMYVTPPVSSSATDAAAGDTYAATRTQLYEQMSKDAELARRVAAALQTSESPAALAKRIQITASHEAPLLTIEATGRSPQEARSLAQAYVDQLPDFARAVEQGSGLRDGPTLVTVAAPASAIPSSITGRPWLLIAGFSALSVALATLFLWGRQRRNPRVTGVHQLRKVLPDLLAVELSGNSDQVLRLKPMLFAARNPARRLIVAGVRRDDGLEGALLRLKRLLHTGTHPGDDLVAGDSMANGSTRQRLIISAPALLDESHRIPTLAIQANTAVIVCRRHRTRVSEVMDLATLLSRNGVDLKGILIAGRRRLPREKAQLAAATDDGDGDGDGERPWPRIDVLEAGAKGSRTDETRS